MSQTKLRRYEVTKFRSCEVTKSRGDSGQTSLQESIGHGVLAPSFVVSFSHDEASLDLTLEAVREVLKTYSRALEDGLEKLLEGRPVQPVCLTG